MAIFSGTLRSNEIFAALFNMILSQETFSDNFADNYRLVDKARADGSLYGDTKLYYSADALKTRDWGKDGATNILELERPQAPKCQAIFLDIFKQIGLTVDSYLSKRAWSTEGAFTSFNSVMLSMIRETKKIHEGTLYNVYIGTTETNIGKQFQEWAISDVVGNAEGLEASRIEATEIGRRMADLLVEMKDYNRDFNDYGHIRSYSEGAIKVIWNSAVYNKLRKVDLPTIFHKEGLLDKFDQDVLPARYFGHINEESGTTSSSNTNVRALAEGIYGGKHLFAGDLLPNSTDYDANTTYTEDNEIICKICVKLPPFMSAFETGTSFFNPKSLTETHWLTWGYNTLQYLQNYPFITVHKD